MASLPTLTILEESQVSPPSTTIDNRSLQLTSFDILWIAMDPIHQLFFYELSLTKTQFMETIVPNLKHSLSIALQHFFPFAGKLILFPTHPKNLEIRYTDGDSVAVTIAECNLDFDNLTGNHPRACNEFYHLIPQLGQSVKISDYITIPVFSVQVTLFPNHGISIGMTNHHSLCDATTRFCFLKAWTSIAQFGTDEPFLANGTLPLYERLVNKPELEESYLKFSKVETFTEKYQPLSLSGPTDKVRATFFLTQTTIGRLKKYVSTQLPTLPYVSSFTVVCSYIWSCIAKLRHDGLELFGFAVDCRARMDPPIPTSYFGNCVTLCMAMAKTTILTKKGGFLIAANLIGENLHKLLTDNNWIMKDIPDQGSLFTEGMPPTFTGVSGTPKLKSYDIDFGWGKPKKHETISIDYNCSISLNACKESDEDWEIGVCLSATEMEVFVRIFNDGLKAYL